MLFAVVAAFAVVTSAAQASQKIVSYSICAGNDCHNTPSQHNFAVPGAVIVATGLPPAFRINSLTYACAAFCRNSALWPTILLTKGKDGSHFLLNAHHSPAVTSSSTARDTVLTLNIWVRY